MVHEQKTSIIVNSVALALFLVAYLTFSKKAVVSNSNAISLSTKRNLSSPKRPIIPTTLIFTDADNILETKEPKEIYQNVVNTIELFENAWREMYAKPHIRVIFLSDKRCSKVIKEVFPVLSQHFDNEAKGPHKGDVCRNAALYKYGGYYFDTDMKTVKPLILDRSITFATVLEPYLNNFFNSFIAAAPGHPIIRKAMEAMQYHYEGIVDGFIDSLGPRTLKWAHDRVSQEVRDTSFLLEEIALERREYRKMYSQIPLQKGYGCCCNFVVHDPNAKEVYFYSRIPSPAHLNNNRCSTRPIKPRIPPYLLNV